MLTCKLNGRLGNQLFEIASTIGVAIRMGYSFGFDFRSPFVHALPKFEGNKKTYKVPWGFHNIHPPDGSELDGYMQSEKYFKHCKELIRFYFGQQDSVERYPDNAVCVHIRLGDYKGSTIHPVCTREYYTKAMSLMPKDSVYYLFSDEPDLAEKILPGMNVVKGNNEVTDLMLMSKFKRHIMSNSSYDWWAVWLSRSCQVIVPRRWFGNELDASDIYCEGWQIV
jgi:hypothetical protein